MDRYAEAIDICRLLTEQGFSTMLAGGCVRDRQMGLTPKDFDLATTALPDEMSDFLGKKRLKVIPTGLGHGTITVFTGRQSIEITSLRSDTACDGRHARVVFTRDFAEDARRRDFTINALFEDVNGHIHDFTGGLDDIRARRLRFVGEAGKRIREDYLRSLRYFRFLARFGWAPSRDQVRAIRHHRGGLKKLSLERVRTEMDAIFTAPYLARVWPVMNQAGVPRTLFPWYRESAAALGVNLAEQFRDEAVIWFWFSLFLFSRFDFSTAQFRAELERLRFSRPHRRALLGLGRLSLSLTHKQVSLMAALDLAETGEVKTPVLKAFLEVLDHLQVLDLPARMAEFLDGFSQLPRPSIPRETLLLLPARKRGTAVRRAKIAWYLGLARDKKQLAKCIVDARHGQNASDSLSLKESQPKE